LANLGVNLHLRLCGGHDTATAQTLDCLDIGRSGTRPGLETLAVIMDREPSRGRTLSKEVVMKHRIPIATLIAFLALLIAIPLNAAAFKGPDLEGRKGPCIHRHKKDGAELCMRFVNQNLAVEAIAELSGQPQEIIRQKLDRKRPYLLLAEYGIEPKAFRSAMEIRHRALLYKLNEMGYLTSDQLTLIQERKNRRAERRALMQKLVEAGLENGTITQEEAASLVPRDRGRF